MPALDATTAAMLLNGLTGQSAFVATAAPLKLRLTMNVPTATASGTEISGPGYTAGGLTVTFGTPNTTSAGAQCQNTNTLTWTNGGAAVWVIVGMEVWDSSPARKAYGLWDGQPITVGPGSQFPVAVAGVTWAFP